MSQQDSGDLQCPRCQATFQDGEKRCQSCGKKLVSDFEFIHNPWVVLGLLFLVMGVTGLPVLWISRGFSPTAKVLLSIVVTAYTAALFWLTWLVLYWSYHSVMGAL